jgi:SAM-dependent methyltransferase
MKPATAIEQARTDFVLTLRRRWADVMYPALAREYADAAAHTGPQDGLAVGARDLAVYPWFAWLERTSQKMLWRAVAEVVGQHPDEVITEPPSSGPATLALDPGLPLPDWYTQTDIHLQPGGLWRHADAAAVYELGAKLVMLGENDDYRFHQLFVNSAVPAADYRCIVDLGCGFGKSTRPFKRTWPSARVVGIDLAPGVLTLATAQASTSDLAIDFIQADGRRTPLPAGIADLVTATMLLHEMPPDALAELFREVARLLTDWGIVRMLDFQLTGQPLRDLAMTEHGARNNEPYMPMLFRTDVIGLCRQAGLDEARWVAFDERGAGRLDALAWPDRAEWHFPWAVLEARKPVS